LCSTGVAAQDSNGKDLPVDNIRAPMHSAWYVFRNKVKKLLPPEELDRFNNLQDDEAKRAFVNSKIPPGVKHGSNPTEPGKPANEATSTSAINNQKYGSKTGVGRNYRIMLCFASLCSVRDSVARCRCLHCMLTYSGHCLCVFGSRRRRPKHIQYVASCRDGHFLAGRRWSGATRERR